MTATTSTQKTSLCDNANKNNLGLTSQSVNLNKSELPQNAINGPLPQSVTNNQNLIPSNGQLVQRLQTIQLPAQKQQMLKSIQAQIQTILAHKPNSPAEQAILTKLYQEQTKILASGKVISSTPHPVSSVSTRQNIAYVISITDIVYT